MNKEVLDLLNEQIWLENQASCYYLQLSIEFKNKGFNGFSTFFLNQSEEERQHMLKIISYVLDRRETPKIPQYNYMEKFEESFDVLFFFETSLSSEENVSEAINNIVSKCRETNDHTTENFIQWFISEQLEEESKFSDIIDTLKMVGDNGLAIYELDKELGSLPTTSEI